jgi:hypothetical protein
LEPLSSLELWGDGDEVNAIEEAFRAIHVAVPVEDAPNWITVGDVWSSVARVAPELTNSSHGWDLFRQGISIETDVDWTRVTAETRLLDGRGYSILRRVITTVREWLSGSHA